VRALRTALDSREERAELRKVRDHGVALFFGQRGELASFDRARDPTCRAAGSLDVLDAAAYPDAASLREARERARDDPYSEGRQRQRSKIREAQLAGEGDGTAEHARADPARLSLIANPQRTIEFMNRVRRAGHILMNFENVELVTRETSSVGGSPRRFGWRAGAHSSEQITT
jgi:hypothetical protein